MKKLLSLLAACATSIQAHSGQFTHERDAIAAVLMAEARGEGELGMRAVAEVIRNRGGDPFMQILRRKQFSCLNGITIEQLISRMSKERGWRTAKAIAAELLITPRRLGDQTHGATHYDNRALSPSWAAFMRETATIGNHRFYASR